MSDSLIPQTPDMARSYCPDCETWRDPLMEVLIEDRCGLHRPSLAGLDDARVEPTPIPGSGDTDGETQRRWAALLRERA